MTTKKAQYEYAKKAAEIYHDKVTFFMINGKRGQMQKYQRLRDSMEITRDRLYKELQEENQI